MTQDDIDHTNGAHLDSAPYPIEKVDPVEWNAKVLKELYEYEDYPNL